MKPKKILSVFIALVMTAMSMPVGVAAENADFVIDENGVLVGYNGPGGDVIIPDGVAEIAPLAFYVNEDITSVIIPESVTKIGSAAFHLCENLADISIPDSVVHIGSMAFGNTAYDSDESNWENGMLYIGNHLIEAYRVNGDITVKEGTVSIAEEAFLTSDPTSVTIPDGVSAIWDDTFQKCYDLTEVILPDSVTYIGDKAFYRCEKLESITLPEELTRIERTAFWKCTALKSITIPDGVTDIGINAFMECTNLESITIPAGVTNIGDDAFVECDKLTIRCFADSPAEAYAIENRIPYELLSPPGDVTGDGKVNLFDVSALLQSLDNPDAPADPEYADVNDDGVLDLADVTLILKYIAKWDVVLR